jgi:hypothetical protein
MSKIVIVILIYHCHKPTDRINLFDLQRRYEYNLSREVEINLES